ncbi:hypothetical protein TSUD_209470 [Trifolium subterraneum]|uniref:Uncharacterized protein n=1 Tax=Trifolium subterraneum TaxID=3900 RepID=A0A2Z6N0K3_TRISU|nr:hypothetical protein TSUD_209470 [Trifolium subterraneum]
MSRWLRPSTPAADADGGASLAADVAVCLAVPPFKYDKAASTLADLYRYHYSVIENISIIEENESNMINNGKRGGGSTAV